MPELDLELVHHALKTARRHGFSKVSLHCGANSFEAVLTPSLSPASAEPTQEEPVVEVKELTATAVGYLRPGKIELFVGQEIRKGEIVAVIESLGIANDVESKWSGRVSEILVQIDEPVEYGQPLARIEKV